MIKILRDYDIGPLLDDYYKIESSIKWSDFGHKGKQTGLQFRYNEDPWSSAVGVSEHIESPYIRLNPAFENTEFEKVIKEFGLRRTRLMWVNPYACYSMHVDRSPRIHIPMITNPECYFVFKSGLIEHLKVGHVYRTNTTLFHTFMNCSPEPRLHLIGVIEN